MAFDQEYRRNEYNGVESSASRKSYQLRATLQSVNNQHDVRNNAEDKAVQAQYTQNEEQLKNLWPNGVFKNQKNGFSGVQDFRESSDSDEGCEMFINSSGMHNGYKVRLSANETQSHMQEEGHTMTSTQCRNGNPWGGLSYADLITAAILSAKNKRMTLEEIYQWLVTNVSYFGDKRDDSSRVGWKNSIRCNLSTRKRFMHIPRASQTGVKTYRGWWTINESLISNRKRNQLMMMFSKEASRPLPSARTKSANTSTNDVGMSSNHSPRTTNRETQTEMVRFCETCQYFMKLMAQHWQTVPPV